MTFCIFKDVSSNCFLFFSDHTTTMWLRCTCYGSGIPCHVVQSKVQATVWCRSSLWSKCPPVPHGTPAPEHTVISSTLAAQVIQSDSMTVWIQKLQMEQSVWFYYLHLIFSKDTVQDQISPENRPLTLNILKQLELCRIVVQPRWVLVRQQPGTRVKPSSSNTTGKKIILKNLWHPLKKCTSSLIPYFKCFSVT